MGGRGGADDLVPVGQLAPLGQPTGQSAQGGDALLRRLEHPARGPLPVPGDERGDRAADAGADDAGAAPARPATDVIRLEQQDLLRRYHPGQVVRGSQAGQPATDDRDTGVRVTGQRRAHLRRRGVELPAARGRSVSGHRTRAACRSTGCGCRSVATGAGRPPTRSTIAAGPAARTSRSNASNAGSRLGSNGTPNGLSWLPNSARSPNRWIGTASSAHSGRTSQAHSATTRPAVSRLCAVLYST